MCITDRHMTLAVKVALNPNTTNNDIRACYAYSMKNMHNEIVSHQKPEFLRKARGIIYQLSPLKLGRG